jgi:hypothetical protein
MLVALRLKCRHFVLIVPPLAVELEAPHLED